MVSGISTDILAAIDKGCTPSMYLAAYSVSYTPPNRPRMTRAYSYDIDSENIDMSSVHFEASNIPGDELEPGGVIPAHLKLNLYEHDSTIWSRLSAYLESDHLGDFSYLYRMAIVYDDIPYLYGPFMAITNGKNVFGGGKTIELDEVSFVLENRTFDFTSFSTSTLDGVATYLMQNAGFVFHSENIYDGANNYTENQVNAREALSRILQANGLFLRSYAYGNDLTNGNYIASPLLKKTGHDMEIHRKYVVDYDIASRRGRWADAYVYVKGANHPKWDYSTFVLDDNPLIVSGTTSAYRTQLQNNICSTFRQGYSFQIPMMPFIELGDCYKFTYFPKPGSSFNTKELFYVSRIEWDGGALMRIEEASYNRNR